MTEKLSLSEAIVHAMNEHIPNKDGSCRSEGCVGTVVAEVNGLFRGNYTHGTPFCNKCDRKYISASHVPVLGIEKFNKSLNEPITI